MGKFEVETEEKAPAGANRKGSGFASGHAVRGEALVGTSEALNVIHVNFDCGEGNEGGHFLECLRVTTAYLSTKLEGDGDVETSLQNWKFFEPSWMNPTGPDPESMKSMLQAEYGT